MAELDLDNLSAWLGITKQQVDILKIIYKLKKAGAPASPKNLADEYSKTYSHDIQKTNLFTQLKTLVGKGLVAKSGKAEYVINLDALKGELEKKREAKSQELRKFDRLLDGVEDYFKDSFEPGRLDTEYLEYDEYWKRITQKVKYAKELCLASRFPGIAYTSQLCRKMKRGDYFEVLMQRCLEDKDLKVTYVTHLDVAYPFNHAFRMYGDYKSAYKETESVLNTLENRIRNHANLDVRFLSLPFSFDIIIPIVDEANEFFIYVRDECEEVVDGLHIKSPATARRVHGRFISEAARATQINKDNIDAILVGLHKRLKELYLDAEKNSHNGIKPENDPRSLLTDI